MLKDLWNRLFKDSDECSRLGHDWRQERKTIDIVDMSDMLGPDEYAPVFKTYVCKRCGRKRVEFECRGEEP